jgi:inorganic triphosphatase YgiF
MERELKFLLDHPHLPALPPGYRVGTPLPTLRLLDEYLDFRGQILAAGWRLRRRRSDGQMVRYTLKSEHAAVATAPLSARTEIEHASAHGEDLPQEIVETMAQSGIDVPHVFSRLQPYLALRQERQPMILSHGTGEIALLSVDSVRATGPASGEECRWSELEIEFVADLSPEVWSRAAADLTAWLAAQPGVAPAGQSKVARATQMLSVAG